LMQWTDPVADPRSSVLRATTNIVYCDNAFRENHVLRGTLNGPFMRVTVNLDASGSPLSVLTDYSANEVRDSQRTSSCQLWRAGRASLNRGTAPSATVRASAWRRCAHRIR